jgi:F0F1-type ATP synthase delta subunit
MPVEGKQAAAAAAAAAADKQLKRSDNEATILVENIKREIKFHRLVSEYSVTPSAKKSTTIN